MPTEELSAQHPLVALLELARSALQASDESELYFICVNDSHRLAPYRQAVLWFSGQGVKALSGVVQMEANVPYVQWAQRVCKTLHAADAAPRAVTSAELPPADAAEWAEWLPAFGLWLPLQGARDDCDDSGGLLLARDVPWQPHEITLLAEWTDMWRHAWQAKQHAQSLSWRALLRTLMRALGRQFSAAKGVAWWRQSYIKWMGVLLVVLLFPVRLTVLAPGELVPIDPAVMRAPLDGVVASFAVKPNESVKAGQLLFSFDKVTLLSRLEVARQALSTAEAEYRQAAQLAVSDAKYKAQLATLTGKIEERRTEADYLQGYLERTGVTAPRDGIALFDDPSEWLGKPVVTGERIMRIAAPNDLEVEAWLAVGDAIPLEEHAAVTLHLNATPLYPVGATLRYMAHDAVQRPDGGYAYRVRAQLDGKTAHRVGLKGTAKLRGGWAPLCYWMLRRPLAAIRQFIGW